MPNYRLYEVDEGGHVSNLPIDAEHLTDEEAVAWASSMLDGVDIELWRGAVNIRRLKARTPQLTRPKFYSLRRKFARP